MDYRLHNDMEVEKKTPWNYGKHEQEGEKTKTVLLVLLLFVFTVLLFWKYFKFIFSCIFIFGYFLDSY